MKIHSISSALVPAAAIFMQFFLWSSPAARASESSLDDQADFLPETEEGEQFASCNANNKVYIQFCNQAGRGVCVVRAGCTYNGKRERECQRDFESVCGYVPENILFRCIVDSCTLIYQ